MADENAEQKTKNLGGRPPAEVDQKQFESLCKMQCTEFEICAWFNITEKTLSRWCKRTYHKGFSQVYAEKRGAGRISLRRHQWQMAETNPTMAIFLGKQYLGQSDRPFIPEEETEDDGLIDALRGQTGDLFSDGDDSDMLPEEEA